MGNQSITPLTSFTETDPTVPAWAKAANKPSYSFSELTTHPTTLSGYGITDAKIQNGTITLGKNSITPLTAAVTWWGRSVTEGVVKGVINNARSIEFNDTTSSDNDGGYIDFHFKGSSSNYTSRIIESGSGQLNINSMMYVTSGMVSVGSDRISDSFTDRYGTIVSSKLYVGGHFHLSGQITLNNNSNVSFLNTNGISQNILTLNTSNLFAIGYGIRQSGYVTEVQGHRILFGVNSTKVDAGEWTDTGQLYIKQGDQGIRIGNGLITCDGTNFKISKTDGSAANLYALGAISALGLNASSGTDAATITTLLTSRINLENTNNYLTKSGLTTAAAFAISAGGNISLNTATVDTSGYVHTGRVYLSSNCYLYTDGSDLRMNLNGTAYKLTKTT
jgi:hypothetical protein